MHNLERYAAIPLLLLICGIVVIGFHFYDTSKEEMPHILMLASFLMFLAILIAPPGVMRVLLLIAAGTTYGFASSDDDVPEMSTLTILLLCAGLLLALILRLGEWLYPGHVQDIVFAERFRVGAAWRGFGFAPRVVGCCYILFGFSLCGFFRRWTMRLPDREIATRRGFRGSRSSR